MYNVQALQLTPAQLTALQALAATVDLIPGPGGARITDTEPAAVRQLLGDRWPVFTRAAFIVLAPSQQIVAHTDPPLAAGRLHVPLASNAGCWSFSNGHWQQVSVGTVYAMDPTVPHGAVNWGATTRLHLMLDLASGVI